MDGKFDLQSTPGVGTTVTITFEYTESIELLTLRKNRKICANSVKMLSVKIK